MLRTMAGAVALWLAAAGMAEAKQVRFVGVHPIATNAGGGFCYLEVPHVHIYEPAKAELLYRVHDGGYYFVGDPVPYGYDGPKHAYYGAHPVPVDVVLEEDDLDGDEVEYCYLDGPHYHSYQPPPNVRFTVKGGVYWYVGDFPPEYEKARPRLARINVVYKPLKYARPVVVVAPPPEYRGAVIEVEEPAVEVRAPHVEAGVGVGVEVHVPAPSVELRVGVPGVVVEEEHHHHHDVILIEKGKKRKHMKHHGHDDD